MKRHVFAVIGVSLLLPLPAVAQTEESQVAAIEEIVVTARKREERLLDTPLSVTALTASELDRIQVDDLGDLSGIVPNLAFNMGDASNAVVYVRGVGQRDSLSFADPGVGVYLDDVYFVDFHSVYHAGRRDSGDRNRI